MLIGAYRDNEVDSAHPLMRKLEAIRQAGAIVHEIVLAPLAREDLGRADCGFSSLRAGTCHSAGPTGPRKDRRQSIFRHSVYFCAAEEALLTFDLGHGRWSWDLNRIHAKGYTDNVVDLMVGKLNRLPVETQKALQELACLGNSADVATLCHRSRSVGGRGPR